MEITSDELTATLIESHILHIRLNRPEQLNALSPTLLASLDHVLLRAKQDAAIKAILLTGEGKGFCAGADIRSLSPLNEQSGLAFADRGQRIFQQLEELGKPSIAAIHGFALGGGCELAMAATLRIAADKAIFGQPEIKLGVIPGFGGTQRLARLIGVGRALEVCLMGERIAADKALEWGLINEITSLENLTTRAIAILKNLIQFSPTALSSIMTVIRRGFNLSLNDGLKLEAHHFALCCGTTEKQENVNAFLQRKQNESK